MLKYNYLWRYVCEKKSTMYKIAVLSNKDQKKYLETLLNKLPSEQKWHPEWTTFITHTHTHSFHATYWHMDQSTYKVNF